MEKCKYCKQDEKGYHEDKCPIVTIHAGYEIAQEQDLLIKELTDTLKLAHRVLMGGKEEVNDDNGETELILTSGDEWVALMVKIENVLGIK